MNYYNLYIIKEPYIRTNIIFAIIFIILFQPRVALACFSDNPKACEGMPRYVPLPYNVLFTSNNFVFDSSIKIDSIFNPILIEIQKLPVSKWIDFYTGKWRDSEFLGTGLKDCPRVTIPKSLFSLLKKTEQEEIILFIMKNIVKPIKKASIDRYFVAEDMLFNDFEYSDTEVAACSIYTIIEQEPNGEYILSLNNTRYRMVKLADNHYVLRKKEKE